MSFTTIFIIIIKLQITINILSISKYVGESIPHLIENVQFLVFNSNCFFNSTSFYYLLYSM